MQRLIAFLPLLLAVPHPADAQAANALRNGVRIEVTSVRGKSGTGRLMLLRSDSLFYLPSENSVGSRSESVSSIALADVKSVRVSHGTNRLLGLLTKGLIGTAIGAGGGALFGAATWSESDRVDFFLSTRKSSAAIFGLLGGATGLVIGSIYGVARGNEQWESVSLPGR